MSAFHLDILKEILPIFVSSNATLHAISIANVTFKVFFFFLKSFANQLNTCFGLLANNAMVDLYCFEKGL